MHHYLKFSISQWNVTLFKFDTFSMKYITWYCFYKECLWNHQVLIMSVSKIFFHCICLSTVKTSMVCLIVYTTIPCRVHCIIIWSNQWIWIWIYQPVKKNLMEIPINLCLLNNDAVLWIHANSSILETLEFLTGKN